MTVRIYCELRAHFDCSTEVCRLCGYLNGCRRIAAFVNVEFFI